ncbi:radical SAM protein [Methylophaga sp.]|uniref:radical SAM protein n=1 Tax=Methylophaga sp. TaxID=2024840 RepID=UPI003A8D7972
MKKILLIVPPNIRFEDYIQPASNTKVTTKGKKSFGNLITDMPLGVISLSAYLKKHIECQFEFIDFNVELNKIDDFRYETFADYFSSILSQRYGHQQFDFIGISALFSTAYRSLIDLGEISSQMFPTAMLIAGGNVPTVSYKEIFKDTDCFDAICHGEGDIPLLNLVKADNPYDFVLTDNSWITKHKLQTTIHFEHKFINDLDEIPFDYSLINVDDYEINPTIKSYVGVGEGKLSYNIMTSRGCPFKCVFCASHATHGRDMRYESVDRVKENILKLKEMGVGVITFEDDHFMGNKSRAYEIVKYVGDIGLTAFFPNSLALYALSREMLQALKNAGVNSLILAVESGSDRVLKKVMKKPLKLEIVRRVAKDCREIGIYTDCNILFGLPGETKEDIAETRAFLKTVDANWFRINVATPIIGSEMYDVCEENDYFQGEVVESNYKRAIVGTKDFTPEFIQEVTYDTNIELNFVNNADMKLGHYKTALASFENVIKVKPDHPIAHYYASICCEYLENKEKANYHYELYCKHGQSDFWQKFINKYDLPIINGENVGVDFGRTVTRC